MTHNQCTIKFHGFKPSDFTHSYLTEKVNRLREAAPSRSTLKAVFSRKGRMFKGMVAIYSSVGRFLATATGNKINEVANEVVDRTEQQLNRWKADRFKVADSSRGDGYDGSVVA